MQHMGAGGHGAQKASDAPELGLQKVGSHWELNLGALRAAHTLQATYPMESSHCQEE